MPVSVHRFEKKKRNITLLKSTTSQRSSSRNVLDKCIGNTLSQKQKGVTIAADILYLILTGMEDQIECLEAKCDLNESES